ncbi:MAG: MerC domain-containing protein [Sphingobium sp.]
MKARFRHALLTGRIDRVAMGVSGLCVLHCVVTAVLLGTIASAGGILENPLFHEIGLAVAILLGAVALGHGVLAHGRIMPAVIGSLGLGIMAGAHTMEHGMQESAYTLIGVVIVALGHALNHRAGRAAQ